MNHKKKILAVLSTILVSVGSFAFASHPLVNNPAIASKAAPTGAPLSTRQSPSPASAPEQVIYRQFFRHAVALKERAKEVERQGKDGGKLRSHYKDKMGLKDEHERILDEIAADTEREVAQLDAKAKKIIDELYARYPKGQVPAGEQLPPPPPELQKLQRLRDYNTLRARHRLKKELGEHGFKQVDDFLKLNFAPNVRPAPLKPRLEQGQPANGGHK